MNETNRIVYNNEEYEEETLGSIQGKKTIEKPGIKITNLNVRPAGNNLSRRIATGLVTGLIFISSYTALLKTIGITDETDDKRLVLNNNDEFDIKKAIEDGVVTIYKYDRKTNELIGAVGYEEYYDDDISNFRYEMVTSADNDIISIYSYYNYNAELVASVRKTPDEFLVPLEDTEVKDHYVSRRSTRFDDHDMFEFLEYSTCEKKNFEYPNGSVVRIDEANNIIRIDADGNATTYESVYNGKIRVFDNGYIALCSPYNIPYIVILSNGEVITKEVYGGENTYDYEKLTSSEGIDFNIKGAFGNSVCSYSLHDGLTRFPTPRAYDGNDQYYFSVNKVDKNGNKYTKEYHSDSVVIKDENGKMIKEESLSMGDYSFSYNYYENGFEKINNRNGTITHVDGDTTVITYKNGRSVTFTNEFTTIEIYDENHNLIKSIDTEGGYLEFFNGDGIEFVKDGIEHIVYFGKYDVTYDNTFNNRVNYVTYEALSKSL